ncbi:ATP-binding cassette domain-containing protein [Metabacillus fastidiosus]|uniref:ABC transporter ATP-binding protein n=1 Tax=Metabacillus fastidiosus TaxID=1458 RepID=A0ABU6P3N3_9BACI|nr:ATP-binding cassette domain-containing protein [Metabacillus fastidiosus]MED4403962.1 ATP-binding cassette domain-containing protein [Metabacillus fastidiosus]MED4461112.1 ATP-binding cassette domain-containing protein [Metabacillus fastidiosus]
MESVLFSIDQLSHRYADDTIALKSLSLTIKQGKKIALLGNNGAGKSTLFLHLNGILQPTSGKIYFKGKEVAYNRKALLSLRRQVGIVFQDPDSQLFSASVIQDISFGPKNLGLSNEKVLERVEWAMEQTETAVLKDKPTHFLSLGQKKRVAIAGVLAMDPEVIILDEPTAGLDAYYSKQIMNVLNIIQKQQKTIILSTHDVNLAYEWADEVVVMHDGEVLCHSDPVTVFQQEEIIKKAHLDTPWVMEMFQALVEGKVISSDEAIAQNKEELFQKIRFNNMKILQ